MKSLVLTAVLCLTASSLSGQQRENLWTARSWRTELLAGSGANLLARGPWMTASVRQSAVKRTMFGLGLSVLYEYGVEPWNHQTNAGRWEDVVQRLSGQVVSEAVIALSRKVF